MSFHCTFDDMETVHWAVMTELHDSPDAIAAPRGKPIRELLGASFTLTNPRNRLILNPDRAVPYGFSVGELCWYLRGDTDLETISHYNKRMAQFSDDGRTINSAYGARMFNAISSALGDRVSQPPVPSQWELCLMELKADPDSRRAIMHINQPRDLVKATLPDGSKDVPCTLSLQLLIRDRRLHMVVNMRSNDVVWGLPHDVFSFTCLQEVLMLELREAGVPVDDLGAYHHHAGSLHVYDTHFDLMAKVTNWTDFTSPSPMKPFTLDGIRMLAEEGEPAIRTTGAGPYYETKNDTERWMLDRLMHHSCKRSGIGTGYVPTVGPVPVGERWSGLVVDGTPSAGDMMGDK